MNTKSSNKEKWFTNVSGKWKKWNLSEIWGLTSADNSSIAIKEQTSREFMRNSKKLKIWGSLGGDIWIHWFLAINVASNKQNEETLHKNQGLNFNAQKQRYWSTEDADERETNMFKKRYEFLQKRQNNELITMTDAFKIWEYFRSRFYKELQINRSLGYGALLQIWIDLNNINVVQQKQIWKKHVGLGRRKEIKMKSWTDRKTG